MYESTKLCLQPGYMSWREEAIGHGLTHSTPSTDGNMGLEQGHTQSMDDSMKLIPHHINWDDQSLDWSFYFIIHTKGNISIVS